MSSALEKLNLRPQEKRFVVITGLIIFGVLNWLFVWPRFDDWGKISSDIDRHQRTLDRYEKEIARKAEYEKQQAELESTGSEMLSSDLELQRIVTSQAAATGVLISGVSSPKQMGASTNQFFQEQTLSVQFSSGGKEIIDFLVGIASGNSMVRVRDMNLRPDPTQTKLGGSILFVGNYQRPATNSAPKVAAAQPRKS